jgi:hypothetical protein
MMAAHTALMLSRDEMIDPVKQRAPCESCTGKVLRGARARLSIMMVIPWAGWGAFVRQGGCINI